MLCQFCKNNGERPEFYLSHNLRAGRCITCPILKCFKCPTCHVIGKHTASYCDKLIQLKKQHQTLTEEYRRRYRSRAGDTNSNSKRPQQQQTQEEKTQIQAQIETRLPPLQQQFHGQFDNMNTIIEAARIGEMILHNSLGNRS